MCGIVGYVGKKKAESILIEGLKRLEYRGYDSAGLAVQNGDNMDYFRAVGKIVQLEKKTASHDVMGTSGIAHTRWATHGEPTEDNAHPHCDQDENVFLIHNGIIENYQVLKKKLKKAGNKFRSDTDTEVLAHLIAKYFKGDLSEAVRKTMSKVEGTFGIAVMHRHVWPYFAIKLMASGVTFSLARNRSPSFSRSSSSTRMIIFPARMSLMASSTVKSGILFLFLL